MGKVSNDKKKEALLNAVNFCIYPCNIDEKYISIPHNEIEHGSDDLSVRFLISNYGFAIQQSIEGVEKKSHFNPTTKDKVDIVKKMFRFKSLKTRIEYEVISDSDLDGNFEVKAINFNNRSKIMSKQQVLDKVKSKDFIVTQYVS